MDSAMTNATHSNDIEYMAIFVAIRMMPCAGWIAALNARKVNSGRECAPQDAVCYGDVSAVFVWMFFSISGLVGRLCRFAVWRCGIVLQAYFARIVQSICARAVTTELMRRTNLFAMETLFGGLCLRHDDLLVDYTCLGLNAGSHPAFSPNHITMASYGKGLN